MIKATLLLIIVASCLLCNNNVDSFSLFHTVEKNQDCRLSRGCSRWRSMLWALPPGQFLIDKQAWEHATGEDWEEKFDELCEFVAVHGHCNVPVLHPIYPWVKLQRYRMTGKKKGNWMAQTISQDQFEALLGLGVDMEPSKKAWDRDFQLLKDLIENNKNQTTTTTTNNKDEAPWVGNARLERFLSTCKNKYQSYVSGKSSVLTKDQVAAMEGLDHVFNTRKKGTWDDMYEAMCEYQDKHGGTKLPIHDRKYKKLRSWFEHQKTYVREFRRGVPKKFDPKRLEALERFNIPDSIQRYKDKYGEDIGVFEKKKVTYDFEEETIMLYEGEDEIMESAETAEAEDTREPVER